MSREQKQWVAYGILMVAVVVAGLMGVRYPMPEPPAAGIPPVFPTETAEEDLSFGVGARYTPFDSVRVYHELNVQGPADFDGAMNVDEAATLASVTSTGAGDFDSTLNVDDDATFNDDMIVAAQTAISVTAGGLITPTGSYQPLESGGYVSATLAITNAAGAAYSAGTLVVLINTVTYTIEITDTGTTILSGNLALDQYDSAVLWFDGTNWIEVSETNN